MDWLRRNWPDLLIGIALVAVIAGIIATLITGGSFFSIGQPTTAATPTQPAVTTPTTVAPSASVPVVAESDPPQADPESPVVVVPDPAAETEPTTSGPTVAVLPPSDTSAPAATPTPEADPGPAVETTPAPVVAAPIVGDPPVASTDAEAPFRVSVGAFSTRENAERQVQTFRDAGYPVLIGAQGELSLALVGPYELRADAERAAAQIAAAGLFDEPLIYTFEPDDEVVATAAAPTPAPAAAPAVATVSQEGTLLQVGAYGNAESAVPQIDLVSGLGFTVQSIDEGGFVKLLVGPFVGEQLSSAQTTLDAAGVSYFVR